MFDDEAEDQFDYEPSHSKPGAGKKKKKSNVRAPAPGGGITQFLMKGKGKKEAETKSLGQLYDLDHTAFTTILQCNFNLHSSFHQILT